MKPGNFDWRKRPRTNNTEQRPQSQQNNVMNLPGFYYDPEKKRYFKIQENNFGQTSIPTNESLRNQKHQAEFELTVKKEMTRRESSLLNHLLKREVQGCRSDVVTSYNELKLKYSKASLLENMSVIECLEGAALGKISTFEADQRLFLLVNIKHHLINPKNLAVVYEITNSVNLSYAKEYRKPKFIQVAMLDSSGALLDVPRCSLPVLNSQNFWGIVNSREVKLYEMKIRRDACWLDDNHKFSLSVDSDPFSWALSPEKSQLAVGLKNSVQVGRLQQQGANSCTRLMLNTDANECYRLDFQKQPPYLLFAGIKN